MNNDTAVFSLPFSSTTSLRAWGPCAENLIMRACHSVLIIELHRPSSLNALCDAMMTELAQALAQADADEQIGCVVLTGSERAFAAGADLEEMLAHRHASAYLTNYISSSWDAVKQFRKPLIAAVAGHAIGGGCELALSCDFILAADNARFSVPEVLVGTVSATQRLPRILGKAKAMEMILTGRAMEAEEAERCGLVVRVLQKQELLDNAVETASRICKRSRPIVMLAKECVNQSLEAGLTDGLRFERRVFHSTLSFDDFQEGVSAVLERRLPEFRHR